MSVLQKSKRKASARQQIDIRGVKDGILMLSHGKYRMVLAITPLNFELKSEDEQDAIIETYESFLNSVGCSLQILIRTREIDMDKYLSELNERYAGETKAVYKKQLKNYDMFIRSLITSNKILTRHFYVVVPFDDAAKADFDTVQEQIALRVDIVRKGLARLGMQSRELPSLEVLDLFYSFYNPEQAKLQPLTRQALELLHTGYMQKGAENE
jgi:uncharacterized protein with GYD domain